MVAQANMVVDGDAAFLRVNSRKPAHALLPGEAAAATNMRFDEGKAQPRLGVGLQAWGITGPLTGVWLPWVDTEGVIEIQIQQPDAWDAGSRARLRSTGELPQGLLNGEPFTVQEETDYYIAEFGGDPTLWGLYQTAADAIAGINLISLSASQGSGAFSIRVLDGPKTCAYARFNDPNGFDNAVLLTDDWRDGNGEDGGRGRAWRICPGNLPQEISLNGHDVWGTARLKQAHHTMILARHGDERHYFSAAAVSAADDTIQLNCATGWVTGDEVLYVPEANSQILGTSAPNANAKYFIENVGSNKVKLYGTKADALASTGNLDFSSAVGKFYLQRAEQNPGFFGNGTPMLIMQPTDSLTAFENGFDSVPSNVEITGSSDDDNTITAPQHRLLIGDLINLFGAATGIAASGYARPLSENTFMLFTSSAAALATGGSTGSLVDVASDGITGSLAKASAQSLTMPPLRELIYYKGRVIGINGKDNIVISDPEDFLHYQMFTGTVPANLGESGNANWLLPLGEDALLVGKELAVLVISGLSGPSSGWSMDEVTREYGGLAPLAANNWGSDGWFFSRRGVASVARTEAGEKLGVARTVSQDIPADLAAVDWLNSPIACSESWNNRFFLAFPSKTQLVNGETSRNDRVIVFNSLSQLLGVQQDVVGGQITGGVVETGNTVDSWEGTWQGALLEPYTFARLKVFGDERLTFATPDGTVCFFTDGFEDFTGAINTSLTPRAYFGGATVLALAGDVNMDTFNPSFSISARTAGYNEEVSLIEDKTFDRTKYLNDGQDDYDPNTSTEEQFDAPHREDYSPAPTELLVAKTDVHQNITENLRMRLRDRAPQLVISNTQGSLRVNSTRLSAKPVMGRGTRQT